MLIDKLPPRAAQQLIEHKAKRLVQLYTAEEAQNVFALPFEEFAAQHLVIMDKQDHIIPLALKPAQLAFVRARSHRNLVLKARQLGFSTAIQASLLYDSLRQTARTITLAHKIESTQALRRMADRFYFGLDPAIRPERQYANASLTTYPALGSENVIATAGGYGVARGMSLRYQHWSEVAWWRDSEDIVAGLLQAGDPEWVVAESTPNGATGWFYQKCMEALDGSSEWKLHFFPWWWDSEYVADVPEDFEPDDEEQDLQARHSLSLPQLAWRRLKRREMKRLFLQEYPEDPVQCFLLSGNGYFIDVLGSWAVGQPAPQPSQTCIAGLDWGKSTDYTVLSIFDREHKRQVALYRWNKLPWGEMRRRIVEACREWHVDTLIPEANSIGDVNIEALREEMYAADFTMHVDPFMTTNPSKHEAADELYEWLRQGGQLLDRPEQRHEMFAFTASQTATGAWKLAAPDGSHDDIVIANMLAAWGCSRWRPSGGIYL